MSDDGKFDVDLDDLRTDAQTWQGLSASMDDARSHVQNVQDIPLGGTGGPGYLAGVESTYSDLATDVVAMLGEAVESMDELASRLTEAAELYAEADDLALYLASGVDL